MVYVCDSPMGTGKTSACINYINSTDKRIMFVTPFLEECERIITACPDRNFYTPLKSARNTKADDILRLIGEGRNIATTHALLRRFSVEVIEAVRSNNYVLILDEVVNPVERLSLNGFPGNLILDLDKIEVSNGFVKWKGGERVEYIFREIKRMADINSLRVLPDNTVYWEIPFGIFEAFSDVYILTYLFEGQPMSAYFKLHSCEYTVIGVENNENGYFFTEDTCYKKLFHGIRQKIHICENSKLNTIGRKQFAFSSGWNTCEYASGGNQYDVLKRNIYNYFRNYCKANSDDCLWTYYKISSSRCSPYKYASSFISCIQRATNKYADRHCLAYCTNRFIDPFVKQVLDKNGAEIDDEKYALSEMIQWIWRSAIRKGEDIYLYIPSVRMRGLLKSWLLELGEEPDAGCCERCFYYNTETHRCGRSGTGGCVDKHIVLKYCPEWWSVDWGAPKHCTEYEKAEYKNGRKKRECGDDM